jgi:hypothetical protein
MSRSFRLPNVPHRNDRSDHPALQAAARLPAYIVLALMIVAVSAGGLLAARGNPTESPPAAAADVTESELPTPVPPSETPLPTPVPLDQAVIVDTAVAFWVEFVPEELAIEYHDEIVAAGGVPWLRPSAAPAPAAAATAAPASPQPTRVGAASTLAPSTDDPGPIATLVPVPVPQAPDLSTPVPEPVAPFPSFPLPLPVPTPTLPPLLP